MIESNAQAHSSPVDDGPYTVYGDRRSGNCYKAALILSLTGRAYDWVETDVLRAQSRTPKFLAMNPNGRVPVLQRADGAVLAESNAMLLHLAENTAYLPTDAWLRAQVYQWLFFEQYSHEPLIAVRRFLLHFEHGRALDPARLEDLLVRGNEALAVMEKTLQQQAFLVGTVYSIADMALYAYTHVAADGGYNLSDWPAVSAWLQRVAAQPGHFDLSALPQ